MYWWLTKFILHIQIYITNQIIKNWGQRKPISSLFSWSRTKLKHVFFLEKWVHKRMILWIRGSSHIHFSLLLSCYFNISNTSRFSCNLRKSSLISDIYLKIYSIKFFRYASWYCTAWKNSTYLLGESWQKR